MNRNGSCWRCEATCTQRCARCRVAFYCSKGCQKRDKWRHKPDCDAAVLKRECMGCRRESEDLLRCSNCQRAWYCGPECQKKAWGRHKNECHEIVEKTIKLAEKIKRSSAIAQHIPGMSFTYYWGNLPAVDLLNLSMNEGEAYSDPLALLLCGVGDPRNVLLTIASLPDVYKQQVTFVLNDICPCTLARTVLLLYMLYKGGDDVTGTVVRVWYSVRISEHDFTLLTSALEDLVTATKLRTLTGGVMEVSADQLSQLKNVWNTWLRLSQRKGPWVEKLRQEAMAADSGRKDGFNRYMHAIPIEHRMSTQHFFDTGIFHSSTNDKTLTRQNATLTGRGFHKVTANCSEFQYSIPPDVLPFTGWDYKAIKKTCHATSLPNMFTIFLKQILHKCLGKLNSDQVKLQLILCDILNIETFLATDLKYDRITTSNLWDYRPFNVLLKTFSCLLNSSNPHSVMLTETENWVQDFFPGIVNILPYHVGIDELCDKALKDTGNPELVDLSGLTTVVEYLDLSSEFLMFLRASLLAACSDNELASFKRTKKIPSVKSLVFSLRLYLRDFLRNENTVFPFKWALNCRRVVMLRGYERALEWKLASTDSPAEASKK